MKEASFYKKLKNSVVHCQLCPHFCIIKENNVGKCKVRKNIKGKLYSLSYGNPVAIHVDPIEKKPLYHFLPGSKTYSIGTAGCNFKCEHCQNWEISQISPDELVPSKISIKEIIEQAIKNNCPSISYTYTEPLVSMEYVLDIAKQAKKSGLKNIIVSNGFINPKPLKELCKYIDAANIDLKGFSENFYKNVCSGKLQPILETLKTLKREKVWLEITTLIIPSLNDSPKEITSLTKWIKDNLRDIPLHLSKYYPMYKMDIQETPTSTLENAYKIAKKYLNYVYIGNIYTNQENTYCPKCNALLIERQGYKIIKNNIKNGKCKCKTIISGVWNNSF